MSSADANLAVQGYRLSPQERRALGFGLQFPTALCLALVVTGLALQSAVLILALVPIGAVAGWTARHPFDLLWNHGLRRLFDAPPLPPNPTPRRHAFKLATVWLLAVGVLFAVGQADGSSCSRRGTGRGLRPGDGDPFLRAIDAARDLVAVARNRARRRPSDRTQGDEMATAVDTHELETKVKTMYRNVAEEPEGDYHFELGRTLAERLGYPADVLDQVPDGAIESFAGVGYFFDLAELREGERVLDLGSGSGMDVFFAATQVGADGSVVGVDFTAEQLAKSRRLAGEQGFDQVEFREGRIEAAPADDESVDCVISNGVINLAPDKERVFAEAARVLRPGGRLAIADIVTEQQLKDSIVCDADPVGSRASAAPPSRTPTARRSRALACASRRSGRTRTSSSPTGPATPAPSTGSRASRCSPSRASHNEVSPTAKRILFCWIGSDIVWAVLFIRTLKRDQS